ncbi:MAG: Ig-like domain-containing protein, partial [Deltaproteobacteria bacterium]|nr:Ig-like domain-containing protein [Deltaproteobacteria bacterium]
MVLALGMLLLPRADSWAAIKVTVKGPGGQASRTLPDAGGAFDVDLPLKRNAVNNITVTAEDDAGHAVSRELAVTQVSLDKIVVSKVTTERLSVEEVEQLVADGVIDLEDPENYNVSTFDIVLTIDKKPVPISMPMALPKNEPSGYEIYKMPKGGNDGGRPKPQPVQIIIFKTKEQHVGGNFIPSIPGVIIIEGNIKSLKEFFNVRLLLMNTSGIFTLSDVNAELELPAGALSHVLPADGINSFGDILPGSGDQPGQKEKEFIIRGDAIGTQKFTVNFGGFVTGPGIADPIPFNGTAEGSVEVKGPPTFQVRVSHPDSVEAYVPYDLVVEITNTGDVPAMYASLELSVDADAQIYFCTPGQGGSPVCEYGDGPAVRSFGHLMPGDTAREVFSIRPSVSGPVTSCMAIADQNIDLQVLVGTMGCMVGHYPPPVMDADGAPTVAVLPAPNATGIHVDAPVVAIFSQRMDEGTIITGEGGSFNVFAGGAELVPGQLRFETMNEGTDTEKTVAIWQVADGITNRLAANTSYTVVLADTIAARGGKRLAARYESEFTTTGSGVNDTTPPTITLSVAPPVNPNDILPGQLIRIDAYASDQGSGISRVELRLKDLDDPDAVYELVGQQSVFAGDSPPFIFVVDSAKLAAGHLYQAMATAYDGMANAQNATIGLVIADSAAPPAVELPADLPTEVLHGISVTLTPTVTGGVNRVQYFLDGAAAPYKTVTLAPWQGTLSTLGLSLGDHEIRVVAIDGLGQQGEAVYSFTLRENNNMPTVAFQGVTDGAVYAPDEVILVNGTAEDPVGVETIRYYLDDTQAAPVYSGLAPISLNAAQLSSGEHTVFIQAENRLGVVSDLSAPEAAFHFAVSQPPAGQPPAPPADIQASFPQDGLVTVTGTAAAGAK